MAVIMGGVFSQAEGFTTLGALWPGLAFHAAATALGTGMLARGFGSRQATPAGALPDRA
jgi:hypothetical protein